MKTSFALSALIAGALGASTKNVQNPPGRFSLVASDSPKAELNNGHLSWKRDHLYVAPNNDGWFLFSDGKLTLANNTPLYIAKDGGVSLQGYTGTTPDPIPKGAVTDGFSFDSNGKLQSAEGDLYTCSFSDWLEYGDLKYTIQGLYVKRAGVTLAKECTPVTLTKKAV
ncbi:hypothetical protein H9Q69_009217 [Fusarium xylarioides]|nr:hypothetical protein H9Q70_011134 [Fusarium xylarioides]KAG5775485.1 hypothetical protein H9Q73_010845 [Fusarium xylarioides]KAG5791732.1 hypothetical protein H9Q69_009217 [Fusarium xylarioides]